jgi:hypothetical protein
MISSLLSPRDFWQLGTMSTPEFFKTSSPFQGVLLVEMNRYVYLVVIRRLAGSHYGPVRQ